MKRKEEWLITEDDLNDGVYAISFVDQPAIEDDFQYFNAIKSNFETLNDEKKIVIGPMMIPNMDIPRRDPETGEIFDMFFSEDTVKMIAHKYLKQKKQSEVTVDHKFAVDGITLVESWIVEDTEKDKSAIYKKQPKGTWMGIFKINNDEIWQNYIKSGVVKGFSVEGRFIRPEIFNKYEEEKKRKLYELDAEIIEKFKELLKNI